MYQYICINICIIKYNMYVFTFSMFDNEGGGSLDPGGYAFAGWTGWCATAASAGCNSQGWKSAVAHGLSNEVPGWRKVRVMSFFW